jgi:hypothetical protein
MLAFPILRGGFKNCGSHSLSAHLIASLVVRRFVCHSIVRRFVRLVVYSFRSSRGLFLSFVVPFVSWFTFMVIERFYFYGYRAVAVLISSSVPNQLLLNKVSVIFLLASTDATIIYYSIDRSQTNLYYNS